MIGLRTVNEQAGSLNSGSRLTVSITMFMAAPNSEPEFPYSSLSLSPAAFSDTSFSYSIPHAAPATIWVE